MKNRNADFFVASCGECVCATSLVRRRNSNPAVIDERE